MSCASARGSRRVLFAPTAECQHPHHILVDSFRAQHSLSKEWEALDDAFRKGLRCARCPHGFPLWLHRCPPPAASTKTSERLPALAHFVVRSFVLRVLPIRIPGTGSFCPSLQFYASPSFFLTIRATLAM